MLDKQTLKTLHHKDQFKDGPEKEYWILRWVFGRLIGEGLPAGSRVWDWSLVRVSEVCVQVGLCLFVCWCVFSWPKQTGWRFNLFCDLPQTLSDGGSLAPKGVSLTESLSWHRSLSHKVPPTSRRRSHHPGGFHCACNIFWQLNKSNCLAIEIVPGCSKQKQCNTELQQKFTHIPPLRLEEIHHAGSIIAKLHFRYNFFFYQLHPKKTPTI